MKELKLPHPPRGRVAARREDQATCKRCQGRQWIIQPDAGNGTAVPCGCRRLDPETLLEAMRIPSAYRVVWPVESFEPWPEAHTRFRVGEWTGARHQPKLIMLTGTLQTGKSTRAVELCRRAIRAHHCRSVAWVTPSELEREERTAALGQPRPKFNRATRSDVTVIDNFGTDQLTMIGQSVLRELLDRRWSRDRSTIMTSSLPFSASQKSEYGARSSIEEYSPEVAARLLSGLVLRVRKTFSKP